MKDYYRILEVSPDSTVEEIRRSYRRLAMRYHPDRNPDDPDAERTFREVAEAYGVLTDPKKRGEYNRLRQAGAEYTGADFHYSQEDILKDLFRDPGFQQMLGGLLREFQRSGFRYSANFVQKSFLGGKGVKVVGGFFVLTKLLGPLLRENTRPSLSEKSGLAQIVSKAAGSLLGRKQDKSKDRVPPVPPEDLDITYHTPLLASELEHGKVIQVLVYGGQGEQSLRVTIPPGSRAGQRLRLKGKGRPGAMGRGDLYLKLVEKA